MRRSAATRSFLSHASAGDGCVPSAIAWSMRRTAAASRFLRPSSSAVMAVELQTFHLREPQHERKVVSDALERRDLDALRGPVVEEDQRVLDRPESVLDPRAPDIDDIRAARVTRVAVTRACSHR